MRDSDIWEFIGAIVIIIGIAASIFVGIWLFSNYAIDKPACEAYGKLTHTETFFSLGTNCLVKYEGEWVKFYVATGNKQRITID